MVSLNVNNVLTETISPKGLYHVHKDEEIGNRLFIEISPRLMLKLQKC